MLVEQRKVAMSEGYARLAADPAAWAGYQAELAEWDGVAGDGLDDELWPEKPRGG